MRLFGIGLALMLSLGIRADVLYDNLSEPSFAQYLIGSGASATLYDSFSTGSTAEVLTGLQLALTVPGIPQDPVTVTLYADGGSTAGSPIVLGSSTVLGSLDDTLIAQDTIADYVIALQANPLLSANSRYWIAVSGVSTVAWAQSTASLGTGVAGEFSAVGTNGVFSNSDLTPFQMQVLASAVPEPSSVFSLIGFLGWGILRLRHRG